MSRAAGRPSQLTVLTSLTVEGGSWLQTAVATSVSPHLTLETLTLCLVPTPESPDPISMYAPILANPLSILQSSTFMEHHPTQVAWALSIHILRNPGLKRVSAVWIHSPGAVPISIQPEPLFDDHAPLVQGLSNLNELVSLDITGLFFSSLTVIMDVLAIVPHLPQLSYLRLDPILMITSGAQRFVYPDLSVLQLIARSNPKLVDLALPIDFESHPPIPSSRMTHPLRSLCVLHTRPAYGQTSLRPRPPTLSFQQILHIARFLERLFRDVKGARKGGRI